ncbi:hypothetical protein B0H13DRAFT_1894824 [Mycena leptocephala]|nr:hypothetical protein B0H13DRAFT_1894824 [Mycena leptocephala]
MTSVADLKHDDEVLRHGGISHLAARIKGDAARGASHGVMDVEDVHGVYCSGVTIPEPGTGSASCPHRYASLHHLLAIQGICGEVVQSEAYVRYGTGLTAKKDAEVKIMGVAGVHLEFGRECKAAHGSSVEQRCAQMCPTLSGHI